MNVSRIVHITIRDFALYSRPLRLDDIHNTNHGRILEEKTRWRHRWRPIRIPADSYKASDNPHLMALFTVYTLFCFYSEALTRMDSIFITFRGFKIMMRGHVCHRKKQETSGHFLIVTKQEQAVFDSLHATRRQRTFCSTTTINS